MPSPRPPAPTGALLLALAVATTSTLPASADAQIHRCTTPEGGTLYTDRSCESMGAAERRPPIELAADPAATGWRGGCARHVDDLVFEVGAAIDAGDTNRLARSYHWTGLSTRSGYAMIERLDAIAQRPMVDIAPAQPDALRIEQTLADGTTPSSTTFGLHRHMDCWWITL